MSQDCGGGTGASDPGPEVPHHLYPGPVPLGRGDSIHTPDTADSILPRGTRLPSKNLLPSGWHYLRRTLGFPTLLPLQTPLDPSGPEGDTPTPPSHFYLKDTPLPTTMVVEGGGAEVGVGGVRATSGPLPSPGFLCGGFPEALPLINP